MIMNTNSCRLCAQAAAEPSELISILEDEQLLQIIEKHIFIKIDPDDTSSKLICKSCLVTVKNWHIFWTKCFNIQQTLSTITSRQNDDLQNLVPESPEVLKTNDPAIVSSAGKTKRTYCMAKWCNNNNSAGSMFRIPKEKSRRDEWLINMGRKDLLNSDFRKRAHLYLCAAHFEDKMFANCKKERLNRTAVPTIFSQPYKDKDELISLENFSGSIPSLNALQDASDLILTCGKLRRILPKSSKIADSSPDSSIVGNSVAASEMSRPIEIDREKKIHGADHHFGIIYGKNEKILSGSLKPKSRNREACRSIVRNDSVTKATTANPQKNISESVLPGNGEEESAMTYDDAYFPASSSLVFQESVHRCTFCGEVFAIKNSLSNHLKTYHLN